MQSAETTEQVYSRLADDPDLADQVEQFVANLPRLLATLHECATERDWWALGRMGRQLKGSSGCYGFDGISARAEHLERACQAPHGEQEILAALTELDGLCGRVRAKSRPK